MRFCHDEKEEEMIAKQLDIMDYLSTQTMIHGDCLDEMRKMADNSIDFVVCDPPYMLNFMGKQFDKFKNNPSADPEVWKEVLRICKPGSMLAAFGGDRTHHHLMNALEEAGWEIRTCCYWLFGSGFPKSHDISKAIDKKGGNPALIDEISNAIKESRLSRNLSLKECDDRFCNSSTNWYWFEGRPAGMHLPSDNLFEKICNEWPELFKYFEKVKDLNREIIPTTGNLHKGSGNTVGCFTGKQKSNIPISSLAEIFSGYGTALKPAAEIIVLAMKPLDGTFAQNAEKWGVAGINIDESRIGTESTLRPNSISKGIFIGKEHENQCNGSNNGRWPSNLILSEETAEQLDQSRFFYCAKASSKERNAGLEGMPLLRSGTERMNNSDGRKKELGESERLTLTKNSHPTVKPISLMKYILKLLAPPGNPICLDPFAGSGSTLLAAKELGINCIGIEKELEYYEIAKRRIENYVCD